MPYWIHTGDIIVNTDNIDYAKHVEAMVVDLYLSGGEVLQITGPVAINLWNFLMSERLSFYDTQTQTRDFSGT